MTDSFTALRLRRVVVAQFNPYALTVFWTFHFMPHVFHIYQTPNYTAQHTSYLYIYIYIQYSTQFHECHLPCLLVSCQSLFYLKPICWLHFYRATVRFVALNLIAGSVILPCLKELSVMSVNCSIVKTCTYICWGDIFNGILFFYSYTDYLTKLVTIRSVSGVC